MASRVSRTGVCQFARKPHTLLLGHPPPMHGGAPSASGCESRVCVGSELRKDDFPRGSCPFVRHEVRNATQEALHCFNDGPRGYLVVDRLRSTFQGLGVGPCGRQSVPKGVSIGEV